MNASKKTKYSQKKKIINLSRSQADRKPLDDVPFSLVVGRENLFESKKLNGEAKKEKYERKWE